MFNIRNQLIQITQGGTFQLPTGIGYLDYLDIDVKEAGSGYKIMVSFHWHQKSNNYT